MNNKEVYVKPAFKYWTASELDSIKATMSGGSGGGFGFRFVWDSNPAIYNGSSALNSVAVGAIVTTITFIATKNASLSWQVAGVAADIVADAIIALNIDVVYYKTYEYLLRAFPVNPNAIGYVCGNACVTDYYADSEYAVSLKKPMMYISISDEVEHLVSSCPGYSLVSSLSG